MSVIHQPNNLSEFQTLTQNAPWAVVNIHATSNASGPLENVVNYFPSLVFVKIDVDNAPDIARDIVNDIGIGFTSPFVLVSYGRLSDIFGDVDSLLAKLSELSS
ncbi:unnamed protein product [Absidia cylindrospora]